jgi:small GTP-binding protein
MSLRNYDYIIKFLVIGDASVGKSNIISKYISNKTELTYDMTIGIELAVKYVTIDDIKYKLHIWDTAGQEMFRSISKMYYRDAKCCLIVYDITNRKSFLSLQNWYDEIIKAEPFINITIIGNKTDLEYQRVVDYEEGLDFAKKYGLPFYETNIYSPKLNEIFENMVTKLKLVKIIPEENVSTDYMVLNDLDRPTKSYACCRM